MPYDPVLNYDDIRWDEQGKPYWVQQSGKRMYIPPISATDGDPANDTPNKARLRAWGVAQGSTKANPSGPVPGQGFLHHRGQWNDETGKYDTNLDWGSVMSLVVGGFLTAGAADILMGAPAGTAATAAQTGVLPSTQVGTGAIGPITGGTGMGAGSAATSSPAWLKAIREGGNIASDIASGRAKGRIDESNINNNADRTALDLYRTQVASNADENNYGLTSAQMANNYGLNSVTAGLGIGNLDLNQKEYALAAPGKRAGNAVRGDILANAQDVTIDGPSTIPKTTINGGLRPSMFSANTRELGGLMSQQALEQQRAGDKFAPLPTVPDYKAPPAYKPPPPPPTLTGPSRANGFDTGLNVAGYAGLGADLLAKYGKYFGL